jgi:hypothetical protein
MYSAGGLSSCLLQKVEVGFIEGVKVCNNTPSTFSFIFVVEDFFILLKAGMNNTTSLQRILDNSYCANLRQLIGLMI